MDVVTVVASLVAALAALGGVLLQSRLAERSARLDEGRRASDAKATRLREYKLREVEATRRWLQYEMVRLMSWLAGSPKPERPVDEVFSSLSLVGDTDLYKALTALHGELQARRPGSMPTRDDMKQLGQLRRRADLALRRQAMRILADEQVNEVPEAVLDYGPKDEALTDAFMDVVDSIQLESRTAFAERLADALIREASSGKKTPPRPD